MSGQKVLGKRKQNKNTDDSQGDEEDDNGRKTRRRAPRQRKSRAVGRNNKRLDWNDEDSSIPGSCIATDEDGRSCSSISVDSHGCAPNQLFCSICGVPKNLDCFSAAQQRNSYSSTRYCLVHTAGPQTNYVNRLESKVETREGEAEEEVVHVHDTPKRGNLLKGVWYRGANAMGSRYAHKPGTGAIHESPLEKVTKRYEDIIDGAAERSNQDDDSSLDDTSSKDDTGLASSREEDESSVGDNADNDEKEEQVSMRGVFSKDESSEEEASWNDNDGVDSRKTAIVSAMEEDEQRQSDEQNMTDKVQESEKDNREGNVEANRNDAVPEERQSSAHGSTSDDDSDKKPAAKRACIRQDKDNHADVKQNDCGFDEEMDEILGTCFLTLDVKNSKEGYALLWKMNHGTSSTNVDGLEYNYTDEG